VANPLDDLAPPSSNPLDSLAPPQSSLVSSNPGEYDPTSAAYQQNYGPTDSGFSGFLRNVASGAGKLYSDVGLGARQAYAQATHADTSALNQEAIDKRSLDAPLAATGGGKVGQFVGALPLAAIPGANTYAGAALIGAGLGATQPTVGDESRLLNTGVGTALGVGGKYVGDTLSSWLTRRAAEPFTGWRQATGNAAAAQSVGSDASALTQPELAAQQSRLGAIFDAARTPDVSIDMTGQTASVLSNAAQDLNQSSRTALEGNKQVANLMTHLQNGTATAEQLGSIGSKLGKEAASQMKSPTGDRDLGQALFAIKDHVDDLVGSSITDPALAKAYAAARPQYRMLTTMESRPSILNSTTGDVNLRTLGNYLQRTDKAGFTRGGNTSPIYEAARFGQRAGFGSQAPRFELLSPQEWIGHQLTNSFLAGSVTGTVANIGSPASGLIRFGLPVASPVAVPYLTQ
jgi:hypothetical protein